MRILYALTSRFPFGRAYASRALNLCRALRDAGHEVSAFCDYVSEEVERKQGEAVPFEGIRIFSTYASLEGNRGLLRRLSVDRDGVKALACLLDRESFDLLITSSTSSRFAGVLHTVKNHGIPLVLETCEWFDSYSWTYGKWDPRHWQCQRCWKKFYSQSDGVIAISRLLEQAYREKGLPVIRIPTVLDIPAMDHRDEAEGEGLRLLFAGDISTGKDRLIEVIEAITSRAFARPVTLDVYGPSPEEVAAQFNGALTADDLKKRENIRIHGFRPQGEINQRCMESDFGLILRPDRRSSNAGFPTKLAEYMAAGTPVIANDTGDITLFLKDGVNGFVVGNLEPDTIIALLEKIAGMSQDELSAMRRAARKTAEEGFDYRVRKDELNAFLSQIKDKDNE